MNARALKPIRFLSFVNGDEIAERGLIEWAAAWADAVMRTEKGKPVGIVPASVRASDNALNGDEDTWYEANMFWPYFEWQAGNGVQIYDAMLYAWMLSGEETFARALRAAFDLVAAELRGKLAIDVETGNKRWAAQQLAANENFISVWSQWRLLTADPRYDDILQSHGGTYLRYRLSQDPSIIATAGDEILQATRYNFPLRTSEALFTDRVYITDPDVNTTAREDIIGMLTGAVAYNSPYFAVTWSQAHDNFTALVTGSRPDRLSIDTWMFGKQTSTVRARLWQLKPGTYRVVVTDGSNVTWQDTVVLEGRGPEVSIVLTGNQRQTITFQRLSIPCSARSAWRFSAAAC